MHLNSECLMFCCVRWLAVCVCVCVSDYRFLFRATCEKEITFKLSLVVTVIKGSPGPARGSIRFLL